MSASQPPNCRDPFDDILDAVISGDATQRDQVILNDTLRTDPVFKLIANRSPDDAELASQPTLSRFENQIDISSLSGYLVTGIRAVWPNVWIHVRGDGGFGNRTCMK